MIVGSYKVIDVRIYVYMYTYAISIVNTPRHVFPACFLLARPPLLTYTYTSTYVYMCTCNTSIANSPRLVKSLEHFSLVLSLSPLSLRTHTHTYVYSHISTSDRGIVNSSRHVTPLRHLYHTKCSLSLPPYINVYMYTCIYLHVA